METTNLAELYDLEPVPWSRALEALRGKQVGNAVPVLLARALAYSVREGVEAYSPSLERLAG